MKKTIIILATALMLCGCTSKYESAYNEGSKYYSDGNYEQAVISFNKAIEINPKDVQAYLGLYDVYQIQKEYGLSFQAITTAMKEAGLDENSSVQSGSDEEKLLDDYKVIKKIASNPVQIYCVGSDGIFYEDNLMKSTTYQFDEEGNITSSADDEDLYMYLMNGYDDFELTFYDNGMLKSAVGTMNGTQMDFYETGVRKLYKYGIGDYSQTENEAGSKESWHYYPEGYDCWFQTEFDENGIVTLTHNINYPSADWTVTRTAEGSNTIVTYGKTTSAGSGSSGNAMNVTAETYDSTNKLISVALKEGTVDSNFVFEQTYQVSYDEYGYASFSPDADFILYYYPQNASMPEYDEYGRITKVIIPDARQYLALYYLYPDTADTVEIQPGSPS